MKRFVKIGTPDVTASVFGICNMNAFALEEALGVRISNEAEQDSVCQLLPLSYLPRKEVEGGEQ